MGLWQLWGYTKDVRTRILEEETTRGNKIVTPPRQHETDKQEEKTTHLNPTPAPASLSVFLTSFATISTRLPRLIEGFEVDMIEYTAENTTGLDVGWEERAERRRDWDW
ncbi:hypothetical protein PILCRDRAFT_828181 [Piloderma croceum F 1598]|uniref:Uncharacterized protein n=1 Tax=Piloderma croceum (strain F 1598) TaxID=765440 RepID=A0A0C3EPI5_PILCF|nr:hypothetical protein PILCRDRAFT_828181 [Piloderma croceum F 1598]